MIRRPPRLTGTPYDFDNISVVVVSNIYGNETIGEKERDRMNIDRITKIRVEKVQKKNRLLHTNIFRFRLLSVKKSKIYLILAV